MHAIRLHERHESHEQLFHDDLNVMAHEVIVRVEGCREALAHIKLLYTVKNQMCVGDGVAACAYAEAGD
jgi:hypothetical protein